MKKLSEFLNSHPDKQISLIYKLVSVWPNIVGHTNAKMCLPFRIKKQELQVVVFDNIYIQGLNFIKEEILEKLEKLNFDIKSIRFTFKANNMHYNKGKVFRQITEQEKKFIERYANMIENEKIRDSYTKALTSYFMIYSLDDFLSIEKEKK